MFMLNVFILNVSCTFLVIWEEYLIAACLYKCPMHNYGEVINIVSSAKRIRHQEIERYLDVRTIWRNSHTIKLF